MSYQIFAWDRSRNKLRQERRWIEFMSIVGLFLAALALFCLNLGNVPLQPETEKFIAQMAKEMAATPLQNMPWLFLTPADTSYLTHPPLLRALIALAYWVGEPNLWTTRLPGALLTAISVPLLYSLGREIFISRRAALFSALIFLTFWPVVRYGRLAVPDGAILCFEIFTLNCILRSRRDLRWALGVGLGLSLLGLTQGTMGAIVVWISLLFLLWDTPRLLSSGFFCMGVLLGCIPALAWYGTQWLHGAPSSSIVLTPDFKLNGEYSITLSWSHLAGLLKYSLPWLIFSLSGVQLAWRDRNWSWAKLVLVWISVCLVLSLFSVSADRASVTIYPALALAGGAILAETVNYPISRPYPRLWSIVLGLLGIVPLIAGINFYFERHFGLLKLTDGILLLILGGLSLTWTMGAILLARRSVQFIPILFWGMYVCLILLVSSPHWIQF